MIEELVKRDWYLGGENSGHVINRQYHTTGDGIIAGLQVLAAMQFEGKSLHELSCDFKKLPQVLINVRFNAGEQPLESDTVQAVVNEVETALAGKGRVLLRKSGTEPLIRVWHSKEKMRKPCGRLRSKLRTKWKRLQIKHLSGCSRNAACIFTRLRLLFPPL